MEKAIALKYARDLPAPFVLAKGKRELARRIVEMAHRNGVEIVEGSQIADRLFEVEIGSWIPEELFEAVAYILAFVYRVQAKR